MSFGTVLEDIEAPASYPTQFLAQPHSAKNPVQLRGEKDGQVVQATLLHGDALQLLRSLPDKSVHLVATDPPYFIDGMGSDWSKSKLDARTKKASVVGGLPVGMKFDPQQGLQFQKFMYLVAVEAMRVLKPGGFFVSFSQARLYHRLAVAVEDAQFEVRDMLAWKYEGQAKAFSLDHFIRNRKDLSEPQKRKLIAELNGLKTPQLKPQLEPMVLGQKPRSGTFLENWASHKVGLVDVTQSLDGRFPGNLMEVPKPSRREKGDNNEHLTVKPRALMEHLVRLFSRPGQVVVDPFLGSGTTGVAAVANGRHFIGSEIDDSYHRIACQRIEGALNE